MNPKSTNSSRMHFQIWKLNGHRVRPNSNKAPLSTVYTIFLLATSLCPRSVLPNGDNVAVVLHQRILARPLVSDKLHRSFEEDFVCRWFEVES